jgi:hypothetical protein
MANLIEKYQVEPAVGEYTRTVREWVPAKDGKRGKFVTKQVKAKRGWMTYLPNGCAVHITNETELVRLGLDKDPLLVDPETGDEFMPRASLKSRAMRSTRNGPVDYEGVN